MKNIISGREYQDSICEAVCDLKSRISSIQKTTTSYQNAIFVNSSHDSFNCNELVTMLQGIEFSPKFSNTLKDALILHALEVEKFNPSFSDFSLSYTVDLVSFLLEKKNLNVSFDDDFHSTTIELLKKIQSNSEISTKKECFSFIRHQLLDKKNYDIIVEICEHAGMDSKIFIENIESHNSLIEIKSSHFFQVETFDEFLNKESWFAENCRCIIIDGIIESVSEFHHILEHASKNIDPIVVVATGFQEDVLQTLYVNNKRKTLNVIPVKLISDESFINSVVDISVVAGTDPVNALKGELISSINYDSLPIVESVEVKNGSILISNFKTEYQSRVHLERLKREFDKKAEGLNNIEREILQESYVSRFRSLSSKSLHISAGQNLSNEQKRNLKIDIDRSLRLINDFRKFGCIKVRSFKKELNSKNAEGILTNNLSIFFNKSHTVPAACLARAVKACHENSKLLALTGGAILHEEK